MHCDLVHKFEQTDEDTYTLKWVDEDGEQHALTMDGLDAIRLHNLITREVGEYAGDYNAAKASFDRGEGPNGEPRGTWERDELTDERDLVPVEMDWLGMADAMNKARKEGMA